MADDGAFGPPAKKRAASRQISKDDDSDGEEEAPLLQAGATFQTASDEVLATRKIVRVRRNAVVAAPPALSPFAGINLIPPSAAGAASGGSGQPADEQQDDSGSLPDSGPLPAAEATEECENVPGEQSLEKEDTVEENDRKIYEEEQEKMTNNDVAKSNSADENDINIASETDREQDNPQHELATSRFAGFGTGFSASSFSFGTAQLSSGTSGGFASFSSASFGSASSSPFAIEKAREGGFPSIFGNSNGQASFQFPATPLIGQQNHPPVSLQEVPVETGEEQEKTVFSAEATLFEFNGCAWKERGKGELKVNVPEDKERRSRLVMRSKGNYRLLLNANLFPDMKLTSMDNRGVTFACVNSASEEKKELATYAVRLKDALSASGFKEIVETHKGERIVALKTPENSPGASHGSVKEGEQTSPV